MSFERVIGRVLRAEGGFVDHPNDKGGPTNFGITQATLASYRGRTVTALDVRNLTLDEAILIFKKRYWDPMGLDRIKDEGIQSCLFDQGVNRGTKTAVLQAQNVANAMYSTKRLTVDGDLGDVTASVINYLNPVDYCREYLQASEHAYVDIVKRNSSQIVFLHGWLNRVHALQDVILKGGYTEELPKVEKLPETPAEDQKKPAPMIPVVPAIPSWLQRAYLYAGKKEQDAGFNKWISGFWSIVGLSLRTISGKSAAWCGLFIAVMLNLSGLTFQKDGAGARNWRKYGVAVDYEKQGIPMGAIVWIDHGRDGNQARCSGDGNHVTFADGDCTVEDLKKLKQFPGFGGNQGDTAKRSMYPVGDICAVRWPEKDKDGKPVPPPQLPITKSRNCSGPKSPTEKTTDNRNFHNYVRTAA